MFAVPLTGFGQAVMAYRLNQGGLGTVRVGPLTAMGMEGIHAFFIIHPQEDKQAVSHAQGKPQDVEEREELMSPEGSDRIPGKRYFNFAA